jgi:hypothetical protein
MYAHHDADRVSRMSEHLLQSSFATRSTRRSSATDRLPQLPFLRMR